MDNEEKPKKTWDAAEADLQRQKVDAMAKESMLRQWQRHNPDSSDPTPVDTLEMAAIMIAGMVNQGRIQPTDPGDQEVAHMLEHLVLLVKKQEPK